MDENQIYYLGRVEKNTIVLKQNSKTRISGNISRVAFRSGQDGFKNIYLDFFDKNNLRTSLCFFTDGENAIKFITNDELKWKIEVK